MIVKSAARQARVQALTALSSTSLDASQADALELAAQLTLRAIAPVGEDDALKPWSAYAYGLSALAHLVWWLTGVREAEVDADRHLRAARLRAEELLSQLDDGDPTHAAIVAALEVTRNTSDPAGVREALRAFHSVPLPMLLGDPSKAGAHLRPRSDTEVDQAPDPLAAAMVFVGEDPALDLLVVSPNVVYPISLRISLTNWPEWAETLEVDFLSALREHASFPRFQFSRPETDADGLWTVTEEGRVVITVSQLLGAAPETCTVAARLVGAGRLADVPVVGVREIRIRTVDPTQDSLGSGSQTYEQVTRMLTDLHDCDVPREERESFARFLLAIVRAAAQMFASRAYPEGASVDERKFQGDLLLRLSMDRDLAGGITEGGEIAGGETDLVYEGIVCENKVERTTVPSIERADRYLGQPVAYASAGGARLSILCILDLTTKRQPPGVLANYIGWLHPAAHGLTDPAYPSKVAVVIVPGNLRLPSDWQGRRVGTAPDAS